MLSKEEEQEYAKKLTEILDKVLADGEFEGTLFLETAGKKIRDLRDKIILDFGLDPALTDQNYPNLAQRVAERTGMVEVYISIYSSRGGRMENWVKVVNALASPTVTRPVYKDEADLVKMIANRPNKQNEAYIAAFVKETEIAKPFDNKPAEDRLGSELLFLKQNALSLENITRFVHVKNTYQWDEGKLVLQSTAED